MSLSRINLLKQQITDPWLKAAQDNDNRAFESLLAAGDRPSPYARTPDDFYSFFHLAVINNNPALIAIARHNKIISNMRDFNNKTAVVLAASIGNWGCVNEFLKSPDISHSELERITAYAFAANKTDLVIQLLNNGSKYFLRLGVQGFDPLHWTIFNNNIELIRHLLAKCTNLMSRNNNNNKTPFEFAADLLNWECLREFVYYKHLDPQGFNYAYSIAQDCNQTDIVEAYKKAGAERTLPERDQEIKLRSIALEIMTLISRELTQDDEDYIATHLVSVISQLSELEFHQIINTCSSNLLIAADTKSSSRINTLFSSVLTRFSEKVIQSLIEKLHDYQNLVNNPSELLGSSFLSGNILVPLLLRTPAPVLNKSGYEDLLEEYYFHTNPKIFMQLLKKIDDSLLNQWMLKDSNLRNRDINNFHSMSLVLPHNFIALIVKRLDLKTIKKLLIKAEKYANKEYSNYSNIRQSVLAELENCYIKQLYQSILNDIHLTELFTDYVMPSVKDLLFSYITELPIDEQLDAFRNAVKQGHPLNRFFKYTFGLNSVFDNYINQSKTKISDLENALVMEMKHKNNLRRIHDIYTNLAENSDIRNPYFSLNEISYFAQHDSSSAEAALLDLANKINNYSLTNNNSLTYNGSSPHDIILHDTTKHFLTTHRTLHLALRKTYSAFYQHLLNKSIITNGITKEMADEFSREQAIQLVTKLKNKMDNKEDHFILIAKAIPFLNEEELMPALESIDSFDALTIARSRNSNLKYSMELLIDFNYQEAAIKLIQQLELAVVIEIFDLCMLGKLLHFRSDQIFLAVIEKLSSIKFKVDYSQFIHLLSSALRYLPINTLTAIINKIGLDCPALLVDKDFLKSAVTLINVKEKANLFSLIINICDNSQLNSSLIAVRKEYGFLPLFHELTLKIPDGDRAFLDLLDTMTLNTLLILIEYDQNLKYDAHKSHVSILTYRALHAKSMLQKLGELALPKIIDGSISLISDYQQYVLDYIFTLPLRQQKTILEQANTPGHNLYAYFNQQITYSKVNFFGDHIKTIKNKLKNIESQLRDVEISISPDNIASSADQTFFRKPSITEFKADNLSQVAITESSDQNQHVSNTITNSML